MDFVQVAEDEGEETIELPTEEDGTLLQSTLQAQYPGSCGLKYRSEDTKAVRGIRINEGRFYPPALDSGWGRQIYLCVFPKENKRKCDDYLENSTAKTKRIETRSRCTDLIVLGLPWKTTEDSLFEHFAEFGEVLMTQIKKDIKSGQSKGFGFVRFADYEVQKRVLSTRHLIDGRWCEVKVPNSKQAIVNQIPCKVFVGRCTEDITGDDLREHFSHFGDVTDVFIPKPFRAFGFVTFRDPEVAQSLYGEDHIVKGISLHVSNAAPKTEQNRNNTNPPGNYKNINHFNGNPNQPVAGVQGLSPHMIDVNGCGSGMNAFVGANGLGDFGIRSIANGSVGGFSNSANGSSISGSSNSGSSTMSRQDVMQQSYNSQNRGSGDVYMQNQHMLPQQHNGGWNNQNQGNMDMPNVQGLGINPQGPNQSNQGHNLNVLSTLSLNSAIVAAALKQWGYDGNQQNHQPQDQQGFGGGNVQNCQSSPPNQGGAFMPWTTQGPGGNGTSGGRQGSSISTVVSPTTQQSTKTMLYYALSQPCSNLEIDRSPSKFSNNIQPKSG